MVGWQANKSKIKYSYKQIEFQDINSIYNYRLESRIETAIKLNRIPKAKFKGIATSIRSTASLPDDIIPSEVKYR